MIFILRIKLFLFLLIFWSIAFNIKLTLSHYLIFTFIELFIFNILIIVVGYNFFILVCLMFWLRWKMRSFFHWGFPINIGWWLETWWACLLLLLRHFFIIYRVFLSNKIWMLFLLDKRFFKPRLFMGRASFYRRFLINILLYSFFLIIDLSILLILILISHFFNVYFLFTFRFSQLFIFSAVTILNFIFNHFNNRSFGLQMTLFSRIWYGILY